MVEVELNDSGLKIDVKKPTGALQMEYIMQMNLLQSSDKAEAMATWVKYRHGLIPKLCKQFKTVSEVQDLTTDDIEQIMAIVEGKILSLMGKSFLPNSPALQVSTQQP